MHGEQAARTVSNSRTATKSSPAAKYRLPARPAYYSLMRTSQDLAHLLTAIDGRGYGGYRQIVSSYQLRPGMTLHIDHAQVDPYAPPSRVRIELSAELTQLPPELLKDRAGRIAVGDFLTRTFAASAHALPAARDIHIARVGQEILERTSVIADRDGVEARFTVKLPAAGRRIRGREAQKILLEAVPAIANKSLLASAIDLAALQERVTYLRNREDLLAQMAHQGIVAFVAAGAMLARAAGDSDKPLAANEGALAFTPPAELQATFTLPSGRTVTGMAIPAGITIIVGGGYHGKSTLLRALERGVYPHIAGDGREWVVSDPSAAAIRAEDGRAVANVDISPFINGLPSGVSTTHFTTSNASGSTSQAANVMEALEAGARTLLIDEDTSATNFMIRDRIMRALIPDEREPITPLVDRITALRDQQGVSTIIVAGGSSAFFAAADHVIAMDIYQPHSLTKKAHELVRAAQENQGAAQGTNQGAAQGTNQGAAQGTNQGANQGAATTSRAADPFAPARQHQRIVDARSLHPADKKKSAKAAGLATVRYGRTDIDLAALNQLVDPGQTAAIAEALEGIAQEADGTRTARELADLVLDWIERGGLDALTARGHYLGSLARPRRQELLGALNRYRALRITSA